MLGAVTPHHVDEAAHHLRRWLNKRVQRSVAFNERFATPWRLQVVTPEEMEAWRIKRARGADDPLLQASKGKADGEKAAVGGYELL